MITVGKEIVLLMQDYHTGRLNANLQIDLVLNGTSGGLLMDLVLYDRIDIDVRRLFVVDTTPLEKPVLNRPLARIVDCESVRPVDHWVGKIADERETVQPKFMGQQMSGGIVVRGNFDRLLVMGTHRQLNAESASTKDDRRRTARVLLRDQIADPSDILVIGLANACGLCVGLLDQHGLGILKQKIKRIARMDLIGQVIVRSIRNRVQ